MKTLKVLLSLLLICSIYVNSQSFELWGWGNNALSQLGKYYILCDSIPNQLEKDKDWLKIFVGVDNTMAIKVNNTLWFWGGDDGDLGTGGHAFTILQYGTEDDWSKISSRHDYFGLGMKIDSSLWGWGENYYGEIGSDSIAIKRLSPRLLDSISKWKDVTTCLHSSLAIKNDGTLWAWGQNNYGQLGVGNFENSPIPSQVGKEHNWEKIFGDSYCVIAIKTDGTLWGWGNNQDVKISPKLNELSINNPVQIGKDSNWSEITFSESSVLGIKNDSTLWAWGINSYGEMGNGSDNGYLTPTQIGNDKWLKVDAGFNHTIGIKSDGSLWGWGRNTFFQVGDGTTINRSIPIKISNTNDWVDVSAGREFSLALRKGGNSVPLDFENSLIIFPNPVSSSFSLSQIPGGAYTFEIYDILGIKRSEGKIEKEINVEFLPRGIYYLKLNNKSIPIKFVKI